MRLRNLTFRQTRSSSTWRRSSHRSLAGIEQAGPHRRDACDREPRRDGTTRDPFRLPLAVTILQRELRAVPAILVLAARSRPASLFDGEDAHLTHPAIRRRRARRPRRSPPTRIPLVRTPNDRQRRKPGRTQRAHVPSITLHEGRRSTQVRVRTMPLRSTPVAHGKDARLLRRTLALRATTPRSPIRKRPRRTAQHTNRKDREPIPNPHPKL